MKNETFATAPADRTTPATPPRGRRTGTIVYALILVVFGVLACAFPLTGSLFAGFTMAWAMIAGGFAAIIAGSRHIREHGYWADLVLGIVTLLFGLAVLAYPLVGAVTILWSLSLWFAFAGAIEIGAAFRLDKGRWLQIGSGILDLLLSALLLVEFARLDLGIVSALVGISLIVSGATVLLRTLAPARATLS